MSKSVTPQPVATGLICSLCGLAWERHGTTPTAETCITLLRADLAVRPVVVPRPIPYPIYPSYPSITWTSTSTTSSSPRIIATHN